MIREYTVFVCPVCLEQAHPEMTLCDCEDASIYGKYDIVEVTLDVDVEQEAASVLPLEKLTPFYVIERQQPGGGKRHCLMLRCGDGDDDTLREYETSGAAWAAWNECMSDPDNADRLIGRR